MPDKNRLDSTYDYLIDSSGEYATTLDTTPPQPLVTPNAARLTSKDRHIQTRAGSTVVTRSSGRDLHTCGGTQPLVRPRSPLVMG